jgi:hypothetical protein
MCTLNLGMVHVLGVCTHIILVHVWCAQYWQSIEEFCWCTHNVGIFLSRDSLINGVHRVLVHSGSVLNFGMVQHIE